MSKGMSIDLNQLEAAIRDYASAIEELNKSVSSVDRAMADLRGTKWNSDAEVAFFAQYSEEWKTSVANHLNALAQVKESLIYAKDQYDEIYSQIEGLRRSLT